MWNTHLKHLCWWYYSSYPAGVTIYPRVTIKLLNQSADFGVLQITDLNAERAELKKQLDEQRAKCDAIEKRENEKRQVEEKKHNEEIQFLKTTNQQLKVTAAE